MRGVPKHLNSKHDVDRCIDLALKGETDKAEVRKSVERLLSDEKVWKFKVDVSSTYQPTQNEKVIAEDVNGTTKYHCFESVDNPDALYLRMGFTKAEIQNFLKQL